MFVLEPKNSVTTLSPMTPLTEWEEMQILRTPSYKEAVRTSENLFFANLPVHNSRAGFQANLRVFIAVTGQIFFVKQNKETVHKHVRIMFFNITDLFCLVCFQYNTKFNIHLWDCTLYFFFASNFRLISAGK